MTAITALRRRYRQKRRDYHVVSCFAISLDYTTGKGGIMFPEKANLALNRRIMLCQALMMRSI